MTQIINKAFLCFLCLAVLAGGVQALSITAGPDQIQEGGQVTVTIQGLEDGSSYSMHIGAEIVPEENQEFGFSSNNLNMPFTLTDTTVTLRAESVVWANFRYQQDTESPTKSIGFGSDSHPVRGGIITDEESFGQITEGSEIAMLEITGKAIEDSDTVSVSFELDGVKSGDDDSTISYTINDLEQGTVSIIVSVDGAETLNKKIQVGETLPTAVPTQSPSGSSGDSDDDYVPNPTSTPDTGLSASSSDGHATLTAPLNTITGAEADDVIIIKNSHPKGIPDNWQLIYGAYIIAPESLGFSEPAELAITGGEGLKTTTSFIAEYDGETWTMLPTVLRGDALVAEISESGSYALMAFGNTNPVSEETDVQQTPDTTSAPTATPATTEPTPTSSGLPVFAGIFTALGAFMVAMRLNK